MATTKAKATAEPEVLVLDFHFEKETPGTLRFKEEEPEDGGRPAIGALYITKKALTKMGNTKTIRVTVEATG
jgi:hypothetical protein